jgi:hypothetical protein
MNVPCVTRSKSEAIRCANFFLEQLLKIQLLKRHSKPTALCKPSWIFNQLHREEGTVSTVPYIVWREKKNTEKELSKNEI